MEGSAVMKIKSMTRQMIYTTSVEALEKQLKHIKDSKSSLQNHFSLALEDSQCHIRNFSLSKMSLHMLNQHVAFDAVDLLGVPLSEAVWDIQVCGTDQDMVNGYYACAPKSVVHAYLAVCKKYDVAVESIIPTSILRVESLAKSQSVRQGRIVFLDLSKDKEICIFVFHNRDCELIRQFPYEDMKQALQEVTRSLKSVCAQSASKKFDHIFCYGSNFSSQELIESLEDYLGCTIDCPKVVLPNEDQDSSHVLCHLNLLRNSQLSQRVRSGVYGALKIAVLSCLVIVMVEAAHGVSNIMTITALKKSFNPAEYERAIIVKKRMENQDGR
jgi:Tfp pilus assembly PilM family ATPase